MSCCKIFVVVQWVQRGPGRGDVRQIRAPVRSAGVQYGPRFREIHYHSEHTLARAGWWSRRSLSVEDSRQAVTGWLSPGVDRRPAALRTSLSWSACVLAPKGPDFVAAWSIPWSVASGRRPEPESLGITAIFASPFFRDTVVRPDRISKNAFSGCSAAHEALILRIYWVWCQYRVPTPSFRGAQWFALPANPRCGVPSPKGLPEACAAGRRPLVTYL